jgi:hypothetical protein
VRPPERSSVAQETPGRRRWGRTGWKKRRAARGGDVGVPVGQRANHGAADELAISQAV